MLRSITQALARFGAAKAALVAVGLVVVGGAVVASIPSAAHTPQECDTIRTEVAARTLVLDAATDQGGLSNAQRDQITRERAINAKALQHCASVPSATPTATATDTPSPSPSVSQPSAPPQPVGFPDASNTGVPAGTVLAPYTGPCLITMSSFKIDAKIINCDLDIRASNVQITNSQINGAVSGTTGSTYSITDSDVDAAPGATKRQVTAIGDGGAVATVLRSDIQGGNRGVYCITGCSVRDSYIHGIEIQDDWHASALRVGAGATVVHNTLWCDAPDNATGGGCSADLTGYPDFEPIKNNTVDNNLFRATPGGYCAYGGATAGKPFSGDPTNATGIKFRGNVFEKGTVLGDHGTFTCGFYGAITDFEPGRAGNEWTNNTYDDGSVLTP